MRPLLALALLASLVGCGSEETAAHKQPYVPTMPSAEANAAMMKARASAPKPGPAEKR